MAIIAITIIVKSLMYPLTKAQYTSMAKMRALQPKMAALKEKFGDDRPKIRPSHNGNVQKRKSEPYGWLFPYFATITYFLSLVLRVLES